MCIEAEVQPMTNEELTSSTTNSQAGAHLDIPVTFERTYYDLGDSHVLSNIYAKLQSVYRKHEQMKKRAYEQWIKHASFSPLVLSATSGLAMEANTFYKQLTPY